MLGSLIMVAAAIEVTTGSLILDAVILLAAVLIWSHAATLDREHRRRAAAEAELRASEARFRSVAETATDAIITADGAGRITFFNPAAERIFRYPAGALLGQPLTILMPERYIAAHEQGVRALAETGHGRLGGSTRELAGRRSDGAEFPIELSLGSATVNGSLTIVGVVRDVTARHEAHAAIARQRQELQEYVDRMSTFSAKVAPDGTLLLVNRAARQASGLSPDALMRTNFLDGEWWAFDPDVQRRVRDAFHAAVGGRQVTYDEQLSASGQRLDVDFSLTPVPGADGRVAYVIAEARDISTLRRTQDALARRTVQLEDANRELESFSYSVAHDLRAPLRAIDGFSRALEEDHAPALTTEGQRLLGVVRANARRMGQLIEDLLAFSRVTRVAISAGEVDMEALAREVVTRITELERGRRIDFTVSPMLPARGDQALLRQVLLNLVDNAAKFTRGREPARIEIGSHAANGEHVYYVCDNGVGFDMRHAPKLFGVFKRLHRPEEFEGTGVGLAIVQRIVSRHGGRVWVDAELDRGATFHFALPQGGTAT